MRAFIAGDVLFSVDENEFARGWMIDFPDSTDEIARAVFKRLDTTRYETILIEEAITVLDIADYIYNFDRIICKYNMFNVLLSS